MAWAGVFHHDAWFAFLEVEHHHGSIEIAASHNHHGEDHEHRHDNDDGDQRHEESIPVPDSHSLPLAFQRAKEVNDLSSEFLLNFEPSMSDFASGAPDSQRKLLRAATEDPPPELECDFPVSFSQIFLPHSVQSNAPPFTS